MRPLLRRLLVLVLSLSLIVGAGVQYAAASGMGAKAASMTSAMLTGSMPDDCGGCTRGDAKMPANMCVAYCSVVVAVLPTVLFPLGASTIRIPVASMTSSAGKTVPPDPYPPRPTILN